MLALQQLERAVLLGGQRLGQGAPEPDEVTQVADRRRWHEARLDQAVAHQVGGPLGILDVGLAPRHGLDVMGVGDDQLEVAFQNGMDRLPVNPGALHADMRDAQLLEPVPHRLQIPRHRREGPDLLARLAAGLADQHTGDHRRLMDVETGTAFDDRIHHLLREADAVAIAAPQVNDRSCPVLARTGSRLSVMPGCGAGQSLMRDGSPAQNPTSLRSPSDRSILSATITSGFTIFS